MRKNMTKKTLTILLTVLLFLSIVLLGSCTVFRVDEVAINATVISEEAKADAEQLKEDLTDAYKQKNIFSVEKEDVEAIAEKYPCFQVISFKKYYPDKIVIGITEQAEVYAVEKEEGGYYLLSESGMVIAERETPENRLDGAGNVLIKGLSIAGERGSLVGGDIHWDSMLLFCEKLNERLGGIRSNVLSVEFTSTFREFFVLTMREGVKIYVANPTFMTEEKAEFVINEYMALSNEQRMTGRLNLHEIDGELTAVYSLED
jgi:hypothetical protein